MTSRGSLLRSLAVLSSLFLVCSFLAFAMPTVSAMQVRQSVTLLASAADGAAELYAVRARGPEGGGSLKYRVQGKALKEPLDFLVSSDFSPGNGSRPQTVSPQACAERVSALGTQLAKHKITKVSVHPERCRAKGRDGLVTLED